MTLNRGDLAVLKASNRIYQVVVDENRGGVWHEQVRFFDDPRHPQWFEHPALSPASRELTAAERAEHAERIRRWNERLAEEKAACC